MRKRKPYERTTNYEEFTVSKWLSLFHEYESSACTTAAQFLRSHGIDESKKSAFNKRYKSYKAGKYNTEIVGTVNKRLRHGAYEDVEHKLSEYIDARRMLMPRDKPGLSFSILQEKSIEFANVLGYPSTGHDAFKASPGWLNRFLQKNDAIKALHSEMADVTSSESVDATRDNYLAQSTAQEYDSTPEVPHGKMIAAFKVLDSGLKNDDLKQKLGTLRNAYHAEMIKKRTSQSSILNFLNMSKHLTASSDAITAPRISNP